MPQTNNETGDAGRSPTSFKVGRIIEEYDLDGLGEELKARWTGEEGERTSLRDLADLFNKRLLREMLVNNGQNPIQSEVERKYENMTGDVSAGVKADARSALEHSGVDVDELQSNFVTHQSVHTYLTEYHNAELEKPEGAEKVEKALETIRRLQSRTLAVTDNTVSRLSKTDQLSTGELEVFVDISVTCTDCGQGYNIGDLLLEGECDCPNGAE
ncbi:hypothetical protein RBH20_18385 [Haloarcula sp. H-GB4]|uniref:rod-determining factor RdfA n=1 Tax=Haloarcula sp. H-GB4 TaxID=3069755 RepID=UPI0027B58FC0|nr:rod-determining factor RdfA [Haloarcula sp. H-GB4]MDQ2074502.1 hypothetical protein [Haloarcula sp. H-GB4]